LAWRVVIVVGLAVFLLRDKPKLSPTADLCSQGQNYGSQNQCSGEFVGASVKYVDGTVTNAGDKTFPMPLCA
jgi:hypothetical protein